MSKERGEKTNKHIGNIIGDEGSRMLLEASKMNNACVVPVPQRTPKKADLYIELCSDGSEVIRELEHKKEREHSPYE